jgi:hypothetical protein
MGFSFHYTGRVKRAEEHWNESHTININWSPRRAAKTKEKPAGLNFNFRTQTFQTACRPGI